MNKKKRYQKYIINEEDEAVNRSIDKLLSELTGSSDDHESLHDYDEPLEEALSNDLFRKVHYNIFQKKKIRRQRLMVISGIVLVFGCIFGLIYFNKLQDSDLVAFKLGQQRFTFMNNNDTVMHISMPDKSLVDLYPSSRVYYYDNFNKEQRNIYLEGEAIFNVNKDASRPFNVISGHVITTAIGTKFKVNKSKKQVFVKLLEGKIIVRKSMSQADSHFLIAGNSILYNSTTQSFTAVLQTANHENSKTAYIKKPVVMQAAPKVLSLNNEPLSEALDRIALQYGVEIEYSSQDIKDINIIAKLDKSKSVYNILNTIALMNHLQLLELEDKQFLLEKRK